MRTEQEVMDLILSIANADERIRGVMLAGSRADSSVPKDQYQDYDIGIEIVKVYFYQFSKIEEIRFYLQMKVYRQYMKKSAFFIRLALLFAINYDTCSKSS